MTILTLPETKSTFEKDYGLCSLAGYAGNALAERRSPLFDNDPPQSWRPLSEPENVQGHNELPFPQSHEANLRFANFQMYCHMPRACLVFYLLHLESA
jgi:hypothetical protein